MRENLPQFTLLYSTLKKIRKLFATTLSKSFNGSRGESIVSEFARKFYPFKSAERVQNDAMAKCYI